MVPGRSSNQGKNNYTIQVFKFVIINIMSDKVMKKNKLLHSFLLYPDASFANQHKGEKVVLLLRAHPITQLPWIANVVVFVFFVILIGIFASRFLSPLQLLFLYFFSFSFALSYAVVNITAWFFNVGIVTTERILDLDYLPLTYRHITETRIFNVEDINSKATGGFASLFNYGNVMVQTAGTEHNIEFDNIPYPGRVVKIINSLIKNSQNA